MQVTAESYTPPKQASDPIITVNTDDKPIRIIGYLILFVMIGIFGTWSVFAPLDSAAVAMGTVAVKSHRKTIQSLDGGIVTEIKVHDGDLVNKGDILLRLDDTQIKAQINILQVQYINIAALIARLNAEQRQSETITFPDEFKQLDSQKVQEAIRDQQQIFQTRRESLQGELALFKQEIEQMKLKANGLQIQKRSKQQLIALYAEEIQDLKALLAEGFADKQRLRELQRKRTQIMSEIAALTTEIAQTQMQLTETKLKILQTKRRFQEDVAAQLEKANVEFFNIKEQLTVAKDKEKHSVIRAPVRGIILGMSMHTIGGVIGPGSTILHIIPEDEELIINAQVSPLNIDDVKVGAEAEVRFSAFSSKTTPVMIGRVQTISADSLEDPKTGLRYYEAKIELTPDSYEKLGDLQLIPGMPVDVLIKTGSRTLFEYLAQPLTDIFARSFTEE